MEETQRTCSCKREILQCLAIIFACKMVSGQIHYSIPEEMHKGSFVGNIAKDLEMDGRKISDSGLRIIPNVGMIQYFAFNVNNGHLETSERIDREEICGQVEKCILKFQILIESKLKLYAIEVEITDINDNAPHFPLWEQELEISEASTPGFRVPLTEAQDPDLGINSIQSYQLRGSSHFSLDTQIGKNGFRHTELILEKFLDREEQSVYNLLLTASDGGDPIQSGTAEIKVIVLDANDNAPVFSQHIYEVNVKENIPKGSIIATVHATDLDEGLNGEVKYSLKKTTKLEVPIFHLNSTTGEIILTGYLDYEELSFYEFEVQAKDGGGFTDRSKVVIFITDLNDNAPELAVTFVTNSILESSPPGTVIAILNVRDRDSGVNGEITVSIPDNLPFQLKKSSDWFYSLMTDNPLDREQVSAFNITVTVTDHGMPPLSTATVIGLYIIDTNDNPPFFEKSVYPFYVVENNQMGALICSLKANDPDWKGNAVIRYSMIGDQTTESFLSSYVSINSETGAIYALTSFDYENFKKIQFQVKAQDGGSPPLSSNSGQTAWLSYQLTRATEPGLFTVGPHNGEIRTTRLFLEKDALKQILVVLVKDNGQPPLSASVTLTVVLADNIPEILSDLSSISAPVGPQSDLTFYLVIAVAFVSCLFFIFLLVLLTIRVYRWRNSQMESGRINFSGVPASQFVGINGVRAFLHSYCHEVSLTADSKRNQFNISTANNSDTLSIKQVYEAKDPIVSGEDLNLNNDDLTVIQVALRVGE
ncbi:protocadherin gamma-A6 [Python bivittatus]|uniref:Protocadherin gamma-A6 n=1 Tax=Python bivittatus TaxID=176946 RepID=A0A9F5IWF5_PYTBI|nr:protocadherin gamma-A6 [Python bivittatus]